jgi:hypothetical protein
VLGVGAHQPGVDVGQQRLLRLRRDATIRVFERHRVARSHQRTSPGFLPLGDDEVFGAQAKLTEFLIRGELTGLELSPELGQPDSRSTNRTSAKLEAGEAPARMTQTRY